MDTLWQDMKYGVRMLLKQRGITTVAVLTLALGIGANTAIFSVTDAIALRPLPLEEPDQIVCVFTSYKSGLGESLYGDSSYPDFQDFREQSTVFSGIAAYSRRGAVLNTGEGVQLLAANFVSGNYFAVLGVKAALGRTFAESDVQQPNAAPVVVVSHRLWQSHLGSDPRIAGKTIQLTNQYYTILGVAPREFRGFDLHFAPDVWIPVVQRPDERAALADRSNRGYKLVGRLRPGAEVAQAQAELDTIFRRLAQAYSATNAERKVTIKLESDTRNLANFGFLLMGIAGLVLLIACANVANLLLARAEGRRREIAVRVALGASRLRLVRQLLTEALLFSLLGAVVAVLFGVWAIDLLPGLFPPMGIPIGFDFRLDARVLGFTLGISLMAVLVFGLAPALRASKADLVAELKDVASAAPRGWRRVSLRKAMVAGQLAVSLMLLTASGLLVRTLANLRNFDPGFNTRQNMLLVNLAPGIVGYDANQTRNFCSELEEGVAALPGVRQVSFATRVPLSPSGGGATRNVVLPGQDLPPGEQGVPIRYALVGAGYFQTLGTRIVRGREFTRQDTASAPRVVVINESMAARFWPGEDVIGKRLRVGGPQGQDSEVIGVAQDGKYIWVTDSPRPYLFLPLSQYNSGELTLLVQTAGDARALVDSVRRVVRGVDKNVPALSVLTLAEHMRWALQFQRLSASLVGALGLLGLLLAAVGLYGVVSYLMNRRTREIGIRMALGAQATDVLKLVVGEGMVLALIGVCVGLVGAAFLTRVISSLLFGVSATDPVTFVGVPLLLAGVALLACYLPARRATKVDPMVALRYE